MRDPTRQALHRALPTHFPIDCGRQRRKHYAGRWSRRVGTFELVIDFDDTPTTYCGLSSARPWSKKTPPGR